MTEDSPKDSTEGLEKKPEEKPKEKPQGKAKEKPKEEDPWHKRFFKFIDKSRKKLKLRERIKDHPLTATTLVLSGLVATTYGGCSYFSDDVQDNPSSEYSVQETNQEQTRKIAPDPALRLSKYEQFLASVKPHTTKINPQENSYLEKKLLSDHNFGEYNVSMYQIENPSNKDRMNMIQSAEDKLGWPIAVWQYFYDVDKGEVVMARKTEVRRFEGKSSLYESSDTNPVSTKVLEKANSAYSFWLKKIQERTAYELESQLK